MADCREMEEALDPIVRVSLVAGAVMRDMMDGFFGKRCCVYDKTRNRWEGRW
jgi:hypothetical protein